MIINAEPMASGARLPAPGSMTVMPTVKTKKNVPMNSTRYFFISMIRLNCGGEIMRDSDYLRVQKCFARLFSRARKAAVHRFIYGVSADAEQFHFKNQS